MDGQQGWSETTPLRAPVYTDEWAGGAFELLRTVIGPLVLGKRFETPEALQICISSIRGNRFAKAALDLAWWDAFARSRNEAVWRLIGGSSPLVDVGADVGIAESLEPLIAEVSAAVQAGAKRVKLKVCPGRDVYVVDAVRSTFPDIVMHIDCNGAYTLDDLPLLRRLDNYELAMIEQPLAYDDLVNHAQLQRQLITPICLDESVGSVQSAKAAIDLCACRWVNLKVGRVGGLTNAIAIYNVCREHGISCWVGGNLESALGQSASLALATLCGACYPADIFPSDRFYEIDLANPPIAFAGAFQIDAGNNAGFGHEPDMDRLARLTIRYEMIEAQ